MWYKLSTSVYVIPVSSVSRGFIEDFVRCPDLKKTMADDSDVLLALHIFRGISDINIVLVF